MGHDPDEPGRALLTVIGERGDDAALTRAVSVCEAALEEFTRERAPSQWAMTQMNLGTAAQSAWRTRGRRGASGRSSSSVGCVSDSRRVYLADRGG